MQTFTLKPEHVTLLRCAYIGWEDCEFGAPAIDCKRPYGNSDVIGDMADILGCNNDDDCNTDALRELHKETQTALQVILSSGSFEPGIYYADDYSRIWRRVAEAQDGSK